MASRQELRAEETKRVILAAAGRLFAARGFDTVTMREIAQVAGCSHTTIYIYFKDKEALLHQLSMGPLQALRDQVEAVLADAALNPDERLKRVSQVFIHFGLQNRTMYPVLFMAKASRVDLPEPVLEVQALRNHLFGLLRQTTRACLPPGQPEDRSLAHARILFFTLHGIITTYKDSEEPFDTLMERLGPTFDLAVEVVLAGLKRTATVGGDRYES